MPAGVTAPRLKNGGELANSFFSRHNSPCDAGLWMKLSLPTVANSPGKLANSMAVFELWVWSKPADFFARYFFAYRY
jgi:hypothetical protein